MLGVILRLTDSVYTTGEDFGHVKVPKLKVTNLDFARFCQIKHLNI